MSRDTTPSDPPLQLSPVLAPAMALRQRLCLGCNVARDSDNLHDGLIQTSDCISTVRFVSPRLLPRRCCSVLFCQYPLALSAFDGSLSPFLSPAAMLTLALVPSRLAPASSMARAAA